jgi:hypothetical protein
LPLALHRELAVLEEFRGTEDACHVFDGRFENLPGVVGELMVAGEADPGFFGLSIPFTIGRGAVEDMEQAAAIRGRADQLRAEYLALLRTRPDQAGQRRAEYLKIIDPRLLTNPGVTVKVPRRAGGPEGARHAFAARFYQEDRALRKLNHPGILRRYASVVDPVLGPCLFLERLRGKSLERILQRRIELRQGGFPLAALAHVALQLAQALAHAHAAGVVHGDLRPASALLVDDAAGQARGIVKLTGFTGGDAPAVLASAAVAYLAPEQARRGAPSPATDVYQLGAMLYALATARPPAEGDTPEEMSRRLLDPEPHANRVHHFRPDISPRFEALIEGARSKDPVKRWPLARVVDAVTQVYATKAFAIDDGDEGGGIAEEILARAQTNAALKDHFRAIEALDLARDFIGGHAATSMDALLRYEDLQKQLEPYREAVHAVMRIVRENIAPVDVMMEELYRRYGAGQPLLKDQEKGMMRGEGEDTVVVRRSLIDRILGHTHRALEELAKVDATLVGDMHRKMVDRASSQEAAVSDLVQREVKFGDDYLTSDPR